MENKERLDKQLRNACEISDIDAILSLIRAGADFEQCDQHGDSILSCAFIDSLYEVQGRPSDEERIIGKIKTIIWEMVNRGWAAERYAPDLMQQFEFATNDPYTYELYKFFIQFDFEKDEQIYETFLESLGTEESYQRTALHDHARENVIYTIYEMVEAKQKHLPYQSVHLYTDAIGKTVDKILYFSNEDNTSKKDSFTEFYADIGFVCGNELLLICEGINILFADFRLREQPQIELPNMFEDEVIGTTIMDISFDHNEIVRGKTYYGQPIIRITLNTGKILCFSHNFGELSENKYVSHFWTMHLR